MLMLHRVVVDLPSFGKMLDQAYFHHVFMLKGTVHKL